MSDAVWAGIIGGIAGVITGGISSIIAPWANWGVEKRNQKLQHRRKLVEEWREMITWAVFAYEHQPEDQDLSFVETLERKTAFLSLKPHLTQSVVESLQRVNDEKGTIRVAQNGETIRINSSSTTVSLLVNAIAEIERKWELV
jgi:hypothetical protein